MKKSKIALTVVLLALVAGFTGWRIWQAYEKKEAAQKSAPGARGGRAPAGRVIGVSVTRARTGNVRQEIEITGSLKPKEQVDVTSKVTGRVVKINVQVGDFIRQGQILAELEDSELAQQVRRAEASRQVVKATQQQRKEELGNARADANRAKQLLDAGLLSRQEYEAKATAFRVFEAQMALVGAQEEQAEAELRELTIQRSQMKIVAPISGYVAQRFVDVGAVVSPSTPVARLVNLSTMVTLANVPEKDLSRLRLGNRAIVTVDAFGKQEYVGKVARISPVLDVATRTALVEIEIPNPGGALRAEMFARVKLDMGAMREAVLVPREALVYRGQQAGVYVVESKKPVFRSVDTGSAHGDEIEVVANLQPGTSVVNKGAAMLQEGDQIRIIESKEADREKRPDRTGTRTNTATSAQRAES
jgi:RND family efflux transporter MFP subunit